jgi:hypothetical protein
VTSAAIRASAPKSSASGPVSGAVGPPHPDPILALSAGQHRHMAFGRTNPDHFALLTAPKGAAGLPVRRL